MTSLTLPLTALLVTMSSAAGGSLAVLAGQASTPAPPRLAFALELRVEVGPPQEFGQVPRGRRRIIPILGGTFEGPNIRGKVLPGGADWQIVRADGFADLDTRYLSQTDSGSLI